MAVHILTEGRVYCQDPHARAWSNTGPSCVITCDTVITAIEKLKLKDHEYLLDEDIRSRMKLTVPEITNLSLTLIQPLTRTSETLHKQLKAKQFVAQLAKQNSLMKLLEQDRLRLLSRNKKLKSVEMSEYEYDTRPLRRDIASDLTSDNDNTRIAPTDILRDNQVRARLLHKFVTFLNKYAEVNYTVDDDLASVLVDTFEEDLNLRFGATTFKNLFLYLIDALRYDSKRIHNLLIYLKPTNCMPIHLPGCLCQTGYVQHKGACVTPRTCLPSSLFEAYLDRIKIL